MIGNDLVDLQLAAVESNWRRKGYLDKVFTLEEQAGIDRSKRPDTLVWLFWSMKEAVYKIHSRITGLRSFAPVSLACSNLVILEKQATGTVRIDQQTYLVKSEINECYIHSIAASCATQLALVKKEIYAYPLNRFDYKLKNPACISHHGRYLALVY